MPTQPSWWNLWSVQLVQVPTCKHKHRDTSRQTQRRREVDWKTVWRGAPSEGSTRCKKELGAENFTRGSKKRICEPLPTVVPSTRTRAASFTPLTRLLLCSPADSRWAFSECSRWIWKWKASQSRWAAAGWPGRWSTRPLAAPHKRWRRRSGWHRRTWQASCPWPWWVSGVQLTETAARSTLLMWYNGPCSPATALSNFF